MNVMKYCEYFDINETYFPCIDESAINAGVDWQNTYPHETFIKLLKSVENMLGGETKRSVWIHGAYGTGKSQCAYALKKILEVDECELKQYWDRYEPLKREIPLLEKLLGHKEKRSRRHIDMLPVVSIPRNNCFWRFRRVLSSPWKTRILNTKGNIH